MKKLLSILGTFSLTAIVASSVIACACGAEKPKKNNKPVVETPKENNKPVVETPKENNKPVVETPIKKILQKAIPVKKINISSLTKIESPEKIIAKDIRKVSEDEYLPLIKNKIDEAINNFDKSLTWKNDLIIDLNFIDWFDGGHLDLSNPKTGILSITGKNNATGSTEIYITLPKAGSKKKVGVL